MAPPPETSGEPPETMNQRAAGRRAPRRPTAQSRRGGSSLGRAILIPVVLVILIVAAAAAAVTIPALRDHVPAQLLARADAILPIGPTGTGSPGHTVSPGQAPTPESDPLAGTETAPDTMDEPSGFAIGVQPATPPQTAEPSPDPGTEIVAADPPEAPREEAVEDSTDTAEAEVAAQTSVPADPPTDETESSTVVAPLPPRDTPAEATDAPPAAPEAKPGDAVLPAETGDGKPTGGSSQAGAATDVPGDGLPGGPPATTAPPADLPPTDPVSGDPQPPAPESQSQQALVQPQPSPEVDTQPSPQAGPEAEIDTLLRTVPCGRVAGRFEAAGGHVILSGHVPSEVARSALMAALAFVPEVDSVDDRDLVVLPPPLCTVVEQLVDAGYAPAGGDRLPYGLPGQSAVRRFAAGEHLRLDLTTDAGPAPAYPIHVTIDYFQTDGNVVHLLPSPRDPDNVFSSPTVLPLGTDELVGPIEVVPPFGTDLLVQTLSTVARDQAIRPQFEPANDYLADIAAGTQSAAAGDQPPIRSLSYTVIVTHP